MNDLNQYKNIQKITKKVLEEITTKISSSSTESSIVEDCIQLLKTKGITSTWYHNTPAFVLLGKRSCLSISGKNYTPNIEEVGDSNLITIDLSPLSNDIWGDCARSIVFHNNKCLSDNFPDEYQIGIDMEKKLHNLLINYVNPETTFEELYLYINKIITEQGFINLDFMGNLGHSINKNPDDRIYIEKGNAKKISSVKYVTFEPHIKTEKGKWGFKHENIYYFSETGKLKEL